MNVKLRASSFGITAVIPRVFCTSFKMNRFCAGALFGWDASPLKNKIWFFLTLTCLSGCSVSNQIPLEMFNSEENTISGKVQFSDVEQNSALCGVNKVELLKVDTTGHVIGDVVASAPFAEDGLFKIYLSSEVEQLFAAKDISYVLRASRCGHLFERALTDRQEQLIDAISTFAMDSLSPEFNSERNLSSVKKVEYEEFISLLRSSRAKLDSSLVEFISTMPSLIESWENFSRLSKSHLQRISPRVGLIQGPVAIAEKNATTYEIECEPRDLQSECRYEWFLDGALVGTNRRWTWTPSANSPAHANLDVKVWQVANSLNPSSAVTRFQKISIQDTIKATAPVFSVVGSAPFRGEPLSLLIQTGVNKENCESFTQLYVSENQFFPPFNKANPVNCLTEVSQSFDYAPSVEAGNINLSLWAHDTRGSWSPVAYVKTISYDNKKPVSTLASGVPPLRGGVPTTTESWAVDAHSGVQSAVLTLVVNGNPIVVHSSLQAIGGFITWTPPAIDAAQAKLRLLTTDVAGNQSFAESNFFGIRSTPPALSLSSPADYSTTHSEVLFQGGCETGLPVYLEGPLVGTTELTCPNGSFSLTAQLAAPDGIKQIVIFQADSVGNTTRLTRHISKDTAPPQYHLDSPISPLSRYQTLPVSGDCENQSTILFDGTGLANSVAFTCTNSRFGGTLHLSPTDGLKTFRAIATDSAGNSAQSSFQISLDTLSPFLTWGSPSGLVGWNRNLTISGSCESGIGIQLKGDGITGVLESTCQNQNFEIPVVIGGISGAKHWTISSKDDAGNETSITKTLQLNEVENPPAKSFFDSPDPEKRGYTTKAFPDGTYLALSQMGGNGHALTWDGRVAVVTNGHTESKARPSNVSKTYSAGALTLNHGESVTFGTQSLTMQTDGNLVLKNTSTSVIQWASGTAGQCSVCRAVFQSNGNLVVSSVTPAAVLFQAATNGRGTKLDFYTSSPFIGVLNNTDRVIWPTSGPNGWSIRNVGGWNALMFKPESLNDVNAHSPTAVETRLQNSFSPRLLWAVGESTDPASFPGVERLVGLPSLNALAVSADPQYLENPFRSDVDGLPVSNGSYMTYKTIITSQYYGTAGTAETRTFLGQLPVTIIVQNPHSASAQVFKMFSTGPFVHLKAGNQLILAIEPSITFDGRLIVYQNWDALSTDREKIYYVYNGSTDMNPNSWSTPRNITQMRTDPIWGETLKKRYPIARYPMYSGSGQDLSAGLLGAYPWIALDGTDLFFAATSSILSGGRRASISAVGASTKGSVLLVDGGPNITRAGEKVRLFTSSLGRMPGMWSPLEFQERRVLPLTDKLMSYPLFSSNGSGYFEASYEEPLDGNYEFYFNMTEGIASNATLDTNTISDDSGHRHFGAKNAGALFAEEAYPGTCSTTVCPMKNSRDGSAVLFSGQPLYFKGSGKVTVNSSANSNHRILENAKQLSFSFALRLIDPSIPAAGHWIFKKGDTLSVRLKADLTTEWKIGITKNNIKTDITLAGPSVANTGWTHLALAWDPTLESVQFYRNGLSVSTSVDTRHAGSLFIDASPAELGPQSTGSTIVYAMDQVGLSSVVRDADEIARQAGLVRPRTRTLPSLPLGIKSKDIQSEILSTRALDPQKIELGKMLFFDNRLSKDRTVSCSSCHQASQSFAESAKFHLDRQRDFTGPQFLLRNTPDIFNLGLKNKFFIDGRANSLAQQARSVLLNPHEMGNDIDVIISRLRLVPGYRSTFDALYAGSSGSGVNENNLLDAIREFQLSMTIGNSKFDRYMAGDFFALSETERRGKALFFGKARCAECHSGSGFTNNSFHKLPFLSLENSEGLLDEGRKRVTLQLGDRGRFLTPGLRSITTSAPYFHDGSAADLDQVVRRYIAGSAIPEEDSLTLLELAESEIQDLISFLNSLDSEKPSVSEPNLPSDP